MSRTCNRKQSSRNRAVRQRIVYGATAADSTHRLHLPNPGNLASGLPSPVLKFAWQRRQTYILELDIVDLKPVSTVGRAAVYCACVWRNFRAVSGKSGTGERRVAMAGKDELIRLTRR